MKIKKKHLSTRLLSLFLSLLMVVTVMPFGGIIEAQAASKISLYWPVHKKNGTSVTSLSRGFSSEHNGIDVKNTKGCYWYAAYGGKVISKYTGCVKNGNQFYHSETCKPNHGFWKTNFVYYYNKKDQLCVKRLKDGALILTTKRNYDHPEYYQRYNVPCNDGFGNGFIIQSKIGNTTYYFHYGHMDSVSNDIKEGQTISAGTYLGTVGDRGNSYGIHAHFSISKKKWSSYINPKDSKIISYYHTLNYKISAENATNITNSSATLNGKIEKTASVTRVRYWISKNKNDLNVVKEGLKGHSDTATMDCRYAKDDGKAVNMDKYAFNISGLLDKPLTPNTTYYYKVAFQINSVWYYSSNVASFKTANSKPGTAKVALSTSKDIGIGDTAAVTWNKAEYADSYSVKILKEDGTQVGNTVNNIKETAYAIPNSYFAAAGNYSIVVTANNAAGSTELTGTPAVIVHDNVSFRFIDPIAETTISEGVVPYGHTPTEPVAPPEEGYDFKKWDSDFSNLKADAIINAIYEEKTFTVKFADSETGKILKTEKVKYQGIAMPPDNIETPTGYKFKGWDKPYNGIVEDTTLNTVYEWYNANYPAVTTIKSIIQDKETENGTDINGYTITAEVKNGSGVSVKKGRLVVALKSENGYFLTESESTAFTLKAKETKTISVFVPFENFAYKAEVFTISEYKNAAAIATPVSDEIDNTNKWSDWIPYTNSSEIPKQGVNGISAVETKTQTVPDKTEYRYKTKSTTQSYETSMSGWTQQNFDLIEVERGNFDYVASWPAGFKKSGTPYTTYNKTPKSAVDNSTTKTVITTTNKGYIYWQWAVPGTSSESNRYIGDYQNEKISGVGTASTWKWFASNTKATFNSSAKAYKATGHSNYSYYWHGGKIKTNTDLRIKNCAWVTYKKRYNYYKWSDWSEWSTTEQTASDDRQVETRVVPGSTTNYYRYKTNNPAVNPAASEEQIINISGNVGEAFAGKEATVFIYKYDQPSDYTNEYLGKTTVGTNGEITVPNALLREAPTEITGDFTIAAAVAGNNNSIIIGKVKAPVPTYTVTYYDFDGITPIRSVEVEEGKNVTEPDGSTLNAGEGYRFTRWNQSSVNVRSNLNIYPEKEKEKYTVVFIDWGAKKVSMEELEYGDEIIPPIPEEPEAGKTVEWDMSDAKLIENNGTKTYVAVKNSVISTVYTDIKYSVQFISPKVVEPTLDFDEEITEIAVTPEQAEALPVLDETETILDNSVEVPDIEQSDDADYIFYGWRNVQTGELLENDVAEGDATYYPVYEFAETTEAPVADVETGEYTEQKTVTLTSETSDAVIYYTTDGSDPKTSGTAIQYTAPIRITRPTVLNAYATSLGRNNSYTVNHLYAVNTSSSGTAYHLVTVYSTLDMYGSSSAAYQGMVRDSRYFNDSEFDREIEGYEYIGLFSDPECSQQFYADQELISGETTLYASYSPKQFNVTFKDWNGTVLSTVSHTYGETEINAPAPSRAGYVFLGWDVEDFSVISKDTVATARYCKEDEYATVTLNKSTVRMIEGQQFTKLEATISPETLSNAEVTWSSSDDSIASVDENGIVTATGKGTVTITVTVEATGESADCVFTILGDYNKSIVFGSNSFLGFDSEGYIRMARPEKNTLSELLYQFDNDEENLSFIGVNGVALSSDDSVGTGTAVKFSSDGEVLDEAVFVMTGDINGDGYIGNADVSMLSQWLVQTKELTYEQQLAGDVNGDGFVDNKDAAVIQMYLVGKAEI